MAPGRRDKGVSGVVGDSSDASGTRTGDDTRKRGWFWHWNSIVTQYAPLLGLKGVGLLNSYTVWTDRREESPWRGYAFPSQQTEADFYGEDRAELITINKILVALDLIEIRKEMVLRTDSKGRRWRVPHNFYRVKDQGDGFSLTSDAVARVVELADRDDAVYRYVRRIFSTRFAPIDRDNVWHRILVELQPTERWQRLAARTERTEKRASARSKAGHAARRAQTREGDFSLPNGGDNATPEQPPAASRNDSGISANDSVNDTVKTDVADANNGSARNAAPSNTGSPPKPRSSDAGSNTGRPSSVGPSNSTYHQEETTTRDTGMAARSEADTTTEPSPPDERRDEDRAFRQFEEANDRDATRAERRLLRALAVDLTGEADIPVNDAWRWIADAIDEAVVAGSGFVAPRRIEEIVLRWSRDGRGDKGSRTQSQHRPRPVTQQENASHRSTQGAVTDKSDGGHRARLVREDARPVPAPPRRAEDVDVPAFVVPESGLTNHQVWSAVIDELQRGGAMPRVDIDAWVRTSALVGVDGDTLIVGVPNVLAERRAAGRYRTTLEGAIHRVTGVRFALRFAVGGRDDDARSSGA